MTYERRTVTQTADVPAHDPAVEPAIRTRSVVQKTDVHPSGGEQFRRVMILLFGLAQIFIGLRIVLLLLNAREGNGIVSFVLDVSQLFVAPFIGIFNSDSLRASGSVLDIAAIAALVGWTIVEVIVLWAVNLLRREPV